MVKGWCMVRMVYGRQGMVYGQDGLWSGWSMVVRGWSMVRMVYGQGMVKGSTIVYTCTHTPLISWSFSFLPPSVQFSLMTDRSLGEHEGLFSRDPPPVFFCRRPL